MVYNKKISTWVSRIVAALLLAIIVLSLGRRPIAIYLHGESETVAVVNACSDEENCSKRAVIIQGNILPSFLDYGIADRVNMALKMNPAIHTICFDSGGGEVLPAFKLAALIIEKKLDTCVTQLVKYRGKTNYIAGNCHSACILAFAAGKHRIAMQPGIAFLFHNDDHDGRYLGEVRQFYEARSIEAHAPKLAGVSEVNANHSFEMPISYSVTDLKREFDLVTEVGNYEVASRAPKCSELAVCMQDHGAECSPELSHKVWSLPPQGMKHPSACKM